jgi:TRAP transporter TAXI family solute receptor
MTLYHEKKEILRHTARILLFILVTVISLSIAAWAESGEKYVLPKTIYVGARSPGASLYTIPATIAQNISPVLNRKIRLIPAEDAGMFNMLLRGKVHFIAHGADEYWGAMGLGQYCDWSIGPVPLRMMWNGLPYAAGYTLVASKVSGIKTPYDLKGKRLSEVVGTTWSPKGLKAALAFGNLTYPNDAVIVKVPSAAGQYKAVAEGKTDATMASLTAAGAYEIEASPYGIQVVRYPHDDDEAWKRLKSVVPYYFRGLSYGPVAGIKEGEKVETAMIFWPIISTLATQDDEFVYRVCKAIYTQFDKIVKDYDILKSMEPKRAIRPEATDLSPYHPGAVRLFKEIGVWNEDLEAANQKRISHLERVQKRWDKYVANAQDRMEKGEKVILKKEWEKIVETELGLLP